MLVFWALPLSDPFISVCPYTAQTFVPQTSAIISAAGWPL
jgi:hypothetical protein